jgi:gamma-butyrobetaine dioxygenase
MITTTASTALQEQLVQKGFVHISYPKSKDYQFILEDLGTIIQTTPIRENPQSTRLLSSNAGMDFHTDHYAAHYVAWLCNSQSATGGESVLIDSFSLLRGYSEQMLYLLSQVTVQSHKVFYNDKPSLPLLSLDEDGNPVSVYYAPWLVNPVFDPKISQALAKFNSDLGSVNHVEILLSEGDLLIIDNHRMLHGRKAFPTGAGRWLTRFWLS